MTEIWVYNRKKSRWQLPHDVTEQISEIVCSKSLWCDGCHSSDSDVIIRGGMNTKRSLKRPEGGWDSHSNDLSVVILLLCNNPRRKGRKWHVERKLELPINFREQIWFSPKRPLCSFDCLQQSFVADWHKMQNHFKAWRNLFRRWNLYGFICLMLHFYFALLRTHVRAVW